MRILLLHSSSDEYGASKIFLGTVRLLNREGHTTLVVLSEPGPLIALLESAGAKVIIEKLGILRRKYFTPGGIVNRLLTLQRAKKKLQDIIREEEIELVFSNTTGVLAGAFAANNCGIRHIWHVHEIIEQPAWLKKIIGLLLGRYSHTIVAVSSAVKESWEKIVPAEKIIIVHNGIDYNPYLNQQQDLREHLGIPTNAIVVGMVGRVHFWKGQNYFLSIAGELHKKYPEVHFLMAGDAFPGYEYLYKEMQQLVELHDLNEVVHQLGFRKDVPAVLRTIDLFLLPSQQPDPFPTVILEAMASALPVIATHFGGALEMIEPGVTGDWMPPDDINRATTIISSWLDKSILQKAGEAGKKRVLEKFSLAVWEEKMLNLLT